MYETPRLVKYGQFRDLTLQTQTYLKAAEVVKDQSATEVLPRKVNNDVRPQP